MELKDLRKITEDIIILCPGKNLGKFRDEIESLIAKNQLITFGINRINALFDPDYHLYTNTQRFRKYGDEISKHSVLMLGDYLPRPLIKKHHIEKYIPIHYTDRDPNEPMSFDGNGTIHGYYRSSACLAIMIAHILAPDSHIYIAGMDGFTNNMKNNTVHYYQDEEDEYKSPEEWAEYDKIINTVLHNLRDENYEIDFEIITPTIYTDFYRKAI